jgi:peroxiredoxin
LKIGEPAPDFGLPDLAGKAIKLSDFRGSPTLVLFWRPSCGFCARMLPDLKAWEANRSNGAPKLLVVSTDSVEDNKAMGLRSPVVLEKGGMSVGSKFGAAGTPMAVLVDAQGKIASELAGGAPAVLALAGLNQARPETPAPSS